MIFRRLKPGERVEVFVTKNRQFRVRIKESRETPPYEVTVGGKEWLKGKGRSYEELIRYKCESLVDKLVEELLLFKKDS